MPDPVQLSLGFTNRPHLVPIDEATVYDVPTKMVELATRIKRGEEGIIGDAVVVLKERLKDGSYNISLYQYGFGSRSTATQMLAEAQAILVSHVQRGI
jgi:hypothetical protein